VPRLRVVAAGAGSRAANRRKLARDRLASDGDPATHREFVRAHGLLDFPYVVSAPLGMSYQVSRLPFAALVDATGTLRARGLVNSREHLESLFEAQRLGVASCRSISLHTASGVRQGLHD